MDKKVRMIDIARQLDISVVSVSKALAGKEGVSHEVRQKILETAQELGYLKKDQTKQEVSAKEIIGILVADRFFSDNTFYSSMYRTILMKYSKLGFSVMLEIVSQEDEMNCVLPQMASAKLVDGIIFMGEIDRHYLSNVKSVGIPHILLDFYDDTLGGDSVCSDNIHGAYNLTKHLIEMGCRKIGFVGNILSTSSILDRYLGYCKALVCNHISIHEQWIIKDRNDQGDFIDFELPEEELEGFICSCDEVAYNLVNKLTSLGYKVPEDIKVAGYDDFTYAHICNPPLTSYHVNVEDMGEEVVTRLVKKIRGKHVTEGCTIIKGYFVARQSTQG